jgi:hypothetical protein
MPTGKPAIRVFYKSAGKVVDPPVCIAVKKYKYSDKVVRFEVLGKETNL